MLLAVHLFYASLSCSRCAFSVLPIVPFGVVQAVYILAQLSLVPRLVPRPELLPSAFALLKLTEGLFLLSASAALGWLVAHGLFTHLSLVLALAAFLAVLVLRPLKLPPPLPLAPPISEEEELT